MYVEELKYSLRWKILSQILSKKNKIIKNQKKLKAHL